MNAFAAGQQGARLQKAKSDYGRMMNERQSGGLRSISSPSKRDAFVGLQSQKFFGNRNVPEERVLRRTAQEGALNQFKGALERGGRTVTGLTTASGDPVYMAQTPGGRTVASYTQDLAKRFGPTPREIVGDIGYGLGQFGSALGQKIGAGEFGLMGIAKGLYEKFTNKAAEAKDAFVKGFDKLTSVEQEIAKDKDKYPMMSSHPRQQFLKVLENEQKGAIGLANQAEELASLNATQLDTYNMLIRKADPLSHDEAIAQVKSQFTDNRSLQERLEDLSNNSNNMYNSGVVSQR